MLGLRNPFGGAWRAADGAQWEVENGPSVDRLAKVVAGRNYLWDGTDASMQNFAAYNWPIVDGAGQHRVRPADDVRRKRVSRGPARTTPS